MRILANRAKEAANRRKHGWGFEAIAEIFDHPVLEMPDHRPLGYEREGRVQVTGRIGQRVVRFVFEPVEVGGGRVGRSADIIARRHAEREQDYWRLFG